MKTNLTAHGIPMLDGWCDDVPEAEVRRREAAARARPSYRRPCEIALQRTRTEPGEVERWREWDRR